MKIFQTIQKNFQSKGICVERVPFDIYEFEHVVAYILYYMMSFLYIVHVAETIMEYIESVSNVTVITIVLFAYSSYRFNLKGLFKIIDDLEQAINKSE